MIHITAPLVIVALMFPHRRFRREGWSLAIFDYLFDAGVAAGATSFVLWMVGRAA